MASATSMVIWMDGTSRFAPNPSNASDSSPSANVTIMTIYDHQAEYRRRLRISSTPSTVRHAALALETTVWTHVRMNVRFSTSTVTRPSRISCTEYPAISTMTGRVMTPCSSTSTP